MAVNRRVSLSLVRGRRAGVSEVFPWTRRRNPFPRCGCGAIGLATIEPEADRLRVAEEVLGMSRRLWVYQAWGLEKVDWWIVEGWT